MSKPPTTWKTVELRIARYLGGQRRGADFSERDGSATGKDDVIGIPGWAIEVKHSKTASYGLACEALDQVDKVYSVVSNEAMPVAIVHKGGLRVIEESVVCMDKRRFWYLLNDRPDHFTVSAPVYSSVKPLWKHIVSGVTKPQQYIDVPCLQVYKIVMTDNGPDVYQYPSFIALSLPNFKEFILPLRS
jgi:hypothetical protein